VEITRAGISEYGKTSLEYEMKRDPHKWGQKYTQKERTVTVIWNGQLEK